MFQKILSVSLLFLNICNAQAQDSASVLFVGNSYVYVNNLPVMLAELSTSLGDNVMFDAHAVGGATLEDHAGNSTTYSKINSEAWDYVVLQAQSQEPSFPDAQVNASTIPYAIQIADSVYANNYCSEMMMFMTWGRENGDPQWGPISTFDGMNARLRSAYIRMADSVNGSVSPVGVAWKYVRDNYPTINLYTADGSHPSYEGSYLAACTFYASIFRKSPVGAPFIGSLSTQVASNLQNAAAIVVLDSLDQWNLHPQSAYTQADYSYVTTGGTVDFTNLSTNATTYTWSFDDFTTSQAENPSNTYLANGTYTVTLLAESPCDVDSVAYTIEITTVSVDKLSKAYTLKSFEGGVFEIVGVGPVDQIKLINLKGQEVAFDFSNGAEALTLDISNNEKGIYVLHIQNSERVYSIRLPLIQD
ncbi:MAG: PKD domain-containing protein [Crocinitomicaceae bacterium]|nr:PKD domain-containing protein [Crocinitomicaceae bacterium]MDG1775932.1 PKD domain-containing protein [Crocinitomicaceae bacterium]